ncbi:hypothetical protein [Streptomyces sp. GS7]|uniref:hypothetical protein n=1 Tax=Streptomyces sp. GS7 TaxID=2692234 RepID=UPI00131617FC|nr:hypothetical protein [Streptomyces sp. GS7]QHC20588.1 hypothetical protein GR130_03205 [Streptomyces sp. GS7]
MNQTVVVAIITAIAALSGSGLTAFLNLRSTRLQNGQQLALAREERTERRVEALRQSRRNSYVEFLNNATSVVGAIDKTRQRDLSDEDFSRLFSAAWDEANSLVPLINVVSVEGPIEVLGSARKLRTALYDELKVIRAVRRGEEPDISKAESVDQRKRAVAAMTNAARDALGGNISTG